MIILDTHIWVWSVQNDPRLGNKRRDLIRKHESGKIGVSAISVWEIAKAVELGRLTFSISISEWIGVALAYPGIELLPLTPSIAIESTQLPGQFHKDPFDQLIVATARIYDTPLVTADAAILGYPYVDLLQ